MEMTRKQRILNEKMEAKKAAAAARKNTAASLTLTGALLTGGAAALNVHPVEAAVVQQQFITVDQAAKALKALHSSYSVRFDHSDAKGNYVIQVYTIQDHMTQTLDWFTVNPKTRQAVAMVNPGLTTTLNVQTAAPTPKPAPAPVQKPAPAPVKQTTTKAPTEHVIKGFIYHWVNKNFFYIETANGFKGFRTTNEWYPKHLKDDHVYTFIYTTDANDQNHLVQVNY